MRALRVEAGRSPRREHRARFARPTPRIREALWLASHGATAAIDISDGLLADAGHLAAASGVDLCIELDAIPVVSGASTLAAARSGEEYELAVHGERADRRTRLRARVRRAAHSGRCDCRAARECALGHGSARTDGSLTCQRGTTTFHR